MNSLITAINLYLSKSYIWQVVAAITIAVIIVFVSFQQQLISFNQKEQKLSKNLALLIEEKSSLTGKYETLKNSPTIQIDNDSIANKLGKWEQDSGSNITQLEFNTEEYDRNISYTLVNVEASVKMKGIISLLNEYVDKSLLINGLSINTPSGNTINLSLQLIHNSNTYGK